MQYLIVCIKFVVDEKIKKVTNNHDKTGGRKWEQEQHIYGL